MSRSPNRPGLPSTTDVQESVVPTLRVMRLQSPELHKPSAGCLDGQPLLHNSLCLPDSLEVLVGESFTAYLGILNVSRHLVIRRLSVSAHLQTPSQRWQLKSPLEGSGVDVPGGSSVDAIVSHAIEEAGQHILRVEVSYASVEGGTKTFRKFYRFQVVNPLTISELTLRAGENSCFVSISVAYDQKPDASPVVISEAEFVPVDGLTAKRIGKTSPILCDKPTTAAQLLDASGFMTPGTIIRYLFQVSTKDTTLRGIAAGDKLGTCIFTWRKSMGETGRIASSPITCPAIQKNLSHSNFVVHRSGLSVDVAAAAENRTRNPGNRSNLSLELPVTVEPIDPPSRMQLGIPTAVEFYVVNHSAKSMTLQLQFRLAYMCELSVCGPSFVTLGSVPGDGGSTAVSVKFLPLATGLLRVQGCWIVDLASDQEIAQPPLFHVFVEDEKKIVM